MTDPQVPAPGFERDQIWSCVVRSSQRATELPFPSMAADASQPCPPVLSTTGEVQAPACANIGAINVTAETAIQTNRAAALILVMLVSSCVIFCQLLDTNGLPKRARNKD